MLNTLAFVLSVVVSVIPQLLQMFDNLPKVKMVLTIVGVIMAAVLVQLKPQAKQLEAPKEAGFSRLGPMAFMGATGLLAGLMFAAVSLTYSCATTGKFTNAVVDCAEDVATNNPTAAANIRTCLIGLTGGGYMQCLSSLPFAAELVICIVQDMSKGTAQAMNSGDVDPVTATINRNANEFLRTNNISRK
jgi:hypothetical protein